MLGQMKNSLEQVYLYLLTEKIALTDTAVISHLLTEMTERVYALESALYLSAATFDAFKPIGNPECHLGN